jgi:hypothetical protein
MDILNLKTTTLNFIFIFFLCRYLDNYSGSKIVYGENNGANILNKC